MNKHFIQNTLIALFCSVLSFQGFAAGNNEAIDASLDQNHSNAFSLWEEQAMQGDAQAQFNLGLLYHGGIGVAQNEDIAVSWYHSAAENGYGSAQEYLAVAYQEGWFGLPRDNNRADYWYTKLQD